MSSNKRKADDDPPPRRPPSLRQDSNTAEAGPSGAGHGSDETHSTTRPIAAAAGAIGKCSICLNPITNRAVTEPCHHEFDLNCITEWTGEDNGHSTHDRCPVCRATYTRILFNIKSETEFEGRDIPPSLPQINARVIMMALTDDIGLVVIVPLPGYFIVSGHPFDVVTFMPGRHEVAHVEADTPHHIHEITQNMMVLSNGSYHPIAFHALVVDLIRLQTMQRMMQELGVEATNAPQIRGPEPPTRGMLIALQGPGAVGILPGHQVPIGAGQRYGPLPPPPSISGRPAHHPIASARGFGSTHRVFSRGPGHTHRHTGGPGFDAGVILGPGLFNAAGPGRGRGMEVLMIGRGRGPPASRTSNAIQATTPVGPQISPNSPTLTPNGAQAGTQLAPNSSQLTPSGGTPSETSRGSLQAKRIIRRPHPGHGRRPGNPPPGSSRSKGSEPDPTPPSI